MLKCNIVCRSLPAPCLEQAPLQWFFASGAQTPMLAYAIVPAAGRGIRMGKARPKLFLELLGKPILAHTLGALSRISFLSAIYLIVPEDFFETARRIASDLVESAGPQPLTAPVFIVGGGTERQDSVYNGLLRLPPECEWVMIHDGVRPFASPESS